MPRPRGRLPIYLDTLSQRVVRHVTQAEADQLVGTPFSAYRYIDENRPHLGIWVKAENRSERLPVACTITRAETEINARVSAASAPRTVEVILKVAHYNDDDMKRELIGTYCLLPLRLKHKSFGADSDRVVEHTENYVSF